jgi:hypothetical protein
MQFEGSPKDPSERPETRSCKVIQMIIGSNAHPL